MRRWTGRLARTKVTLVNVTEELGGSAGESGTTTLGQLAELAGCSPLDMLVAMMRGGLVDAAELSRGVASQVAGDESSSIKVKVSGREQLLAAVKPALADCDCDGQ